MFKGPSIRKFKAAIRQLKGLNGEWHNTPKSRAACLEVAGYLYDIVFIRELRNKHKRERSRGQLAQKTKVQRGPDNEPN